MAVQAMEFEHVVATAPAPLRSRGRARLRPVREDERVVRPALRLTARGRLVRTLAVFGAICLLALVAWARMTAVALPPTHEVTVEAGQSLSQIAAEELPMVPVEVAMLRIRMANGLSSATVMAGQSLVIPGGE